MSLQDWYYQRAKLIVEGRSSLGELKYDPTGDEITRNKLVMQGYERYGDYWPILEKFGYQKRIGGSDLWGYYRETSKILRFDLDWRWTNPEKLDMFKLLCL